MSNKENPDEKAINSLWHILIGSIYLSVILVILTLGYLMLEDTIQDFVNQKTYSETEIAALNKKANRQERIEEEERNRDLVSDGIHLRTGLHDDENLQLIIGACTSCHSAKLITQNKATYDGWNSMLDWMQETQGLPDLGESRPIILAYLAKYYAPTNSGRRKNLQMDEIEWYVLNLKDGG